MKFKLRSEEIRAMLNHAEKEYPRECVGVITGVVGDPARNEIKKLTNTQDLLHKTDPKHFRRDARTGYFADPKEVFQLVMKMEKEGRKILAFYHSHPDHKCYFSQDDLDAAVMWGEPVYPDAVYIVISIWGGEVKEAVIFSWDGKTYSPSETLPVESRK